ncbi:MAG: RNA polymerase sigma factor [Gammaproteobacteria bacterium]
MATKKTSFLGSLFRRHTDEVRLFAQRRVGAQDADDVLQETYLRLLRQGNPETIRDPRAFLFTTAANSCRDDLRKQHTREQWLDPEHDLGSLPSPTPGPDRIAEGHARLTRLQQALVELPALCRDAFLLNRYDGLTQVEIAARLGRSKKTVKRYILRAASHCARALEE